MKILAFTAGAARMYCGSCLRDNALATELKRQGHDVILQPLYTPTRTDELNVSSERVFLNGIGMYLEQGSAFFRKRRPWLDRIFESRWVLDFATRRAIAVNPKMLGEMTVSMLRGEDGHQVKEVRKLTEWLRSEAPPDVVTLPNSLLSGLAGPVRDAVGRPVCCTFAGDELFLSQLMEPYRSQSMELIRANVRHCEGFVAFSRNNAGYWRRELGIPESKMHVVPLGISLEGCRLRDTTARDIFRVGYFARIAPEKGLEQLAESYIKLRKETDFSGARLEAAGYLAPEFRGYLKAVEQRFRKAGLAAEFHYRGELDREQKFEFLRAVDLLSVPATYDEPKGLFLLEAMANGTPVVQPRRGAFTEVLEETGGGLLVNPDDPGSLAEGIYALWKDRELAARLGRRGAEAVRRDYTVARMAERAVEAYKEIAMARAGNA